jgi:putative hydrolase of the HAD superfamily
MSFQAVIFDLGGVVLGSPLHAINRYEQHLGLAKNAINRVAAETSPHGAWSRLERGELSMDAFYAEFEQDCARYGYEISARMMFEWMAAESLPREAMLAAIRRIRARGLRVGALTNNWAAASESDDADELEARGSARNDGTRDLRVHFDVFIESSVEGIRKPDPRMYQLACARLDVEPAQAVFLDDIGANLKPARALGLTTIKVDEPGAALALLERTLGFPLGDDEAGAT